IGEKGAASKSEPDAGPQPRLLHFGEAAIPAGEQGWQGYSVATWEFAGGAAAGGRGGDTPAGGGGALGAGEGIARGGPPAEGGAATPRGTEMLPADTVRSRW